MMEFTMFHSGQAGQSFNTYYRNRVLIRSAEDLKEVCRFDHVSVEFINNQRKNENYICCYAINADCDNSGITDPAVWLTPEKVAARLPGVCFYDCASRNNNKIKHPGKPGEESARPRYHYYFPLRNTIENIDQARKIMAKLLFMFPEFDKDGTKPAQFFFGHDEPVTTAHEGFIDIVQFFEEHPEITIPDEETEQQPGTIATAFRNQDDFLSLNLSDMLASIPADDYGDWIRVGMALKSAGQDVSIWDDWSKSSPKYPGFKAIQKKWNSFKGNNISGGTIVHMAAEHGWISDPDKLTGEYKNSYETAQKTRQDRERKQREQKEKRSAALANLNIEDSASLNVKYDHAGSVAEVIDTTTGEIIYHNPVALVPDPVQPIPGKTIITTNRVNEPASAEEPKLIVSGFDDVEIKPTDYLFFPWFPRGKLVQIQGDTSSSKSTFMYAVGAVVSTGANLLTVPCEDPGNVMFITIEDDESDIKIAFQDAGGDIGHLRRIQDREEIAKLSLSPAGAQMIDRIIKEENIKLLVLDPIQQFINGDMNKANDTRPQLARLMNIAAENNICIVFLAHMGKDTSKAALHRGIGSVDIGAATRSIIQIVTDPEDDFFKIAFSVKNNTADFHDVQRAIRYQVKDHPGSYNPETKQRARYHGHAEFSEILPEYNERLYRKAVRKADEAEEAEEALLFEYDDDPLVITARQLIAENPQGLFIGTDDLIQKITQCAGRCPYEQTKSKVNGIYSRVSKLRKMMIDSDGIQADIQSGPQQAKAYNWRGSIFQPQRTGKTRGIFLTPVKNGTGGCQQTKI